MRPRFLADADFNHKIVVGLRRKEPMIDFLGARTGGVIGLSDPEVIANAAKHGRILVSHDRKTMPGHYPDFARHNRVQGSSSSRRISKLAPPSRTCC